METQTAMSPPTTKAALQVTTTVLPGNRVEVSSPELKEGETVDVILLLPSAADPKRSSVLDIVESLRGHKLFKTAGDVDHYLEEERNSWGH